VSLGIEVDGEHRPAFAMQHAGEAEYGCRFADTAFLVEHRDTGHGELQAGS